MRMFGATGQREVAGSAQLGGTDGGTGRRHLSVSRATSVSERPAARRPPSAARRPPPAAAELTIREGRVQRMRETRAGGGQADRRAGSSERSMMRRGRRRNGNRQQGGRGMIVRDVCVLSDVRGCQKQGEMGLILR